MNDFTERSFTGENKRNRKINDHFENERNLFLTIAKKMNNERKFKKAEHAHLYLCHH